MTKDKVEQWALKELFPDVTDYVELTPTQTAVWRIAVEIIMKWQNEA